MILTNDTTTLNGALTELGEIMADNLVTQGVTDATASDGLTTLAGKILDITGGGPSYNLKFSKDTYSAAQNGSATLTLTLLDRRQPVSGATITITDGNTSSTCTTNSEGVATATVTVTADTVFTATYDSTVTATCTVKKWVDALTFTIYDNYFKSYNTTPFTFTGSLTVDWGDGTTETYTSGYLEHTYSTIDEHTITITGNITQLNYNCFYQNYTLKGVSIPSSVTSLGNSCFYNCYSLKEVSIPSSVTSLGTYCFYTCYSLTSLEIGTGVTTIGKQWLRNCRSLRSLKFKPTTPPTITADTSNYQNVPTNCKIYVPTGKLSNYTSAANYPSSSTYTYVEY